MYRMEYWKKIMCFLGKCNTNEFHSNFCCSWDTGLTQTFIHLPLVPVLQKEWGIGASCSLTSRPLPVKPGTMIKGWLAAKLSAQRKENCKQRCHNTIALLLGTSWNLALTWPTNPERMMCPTKVGSNLVVGAVLPLRPGCGPINPLTKDKWFWKCELNTYPSQTNLFPI